MVWQRRATVQVPPNRKVQNLRPSGSQDVEGDRKGVRVEASTGSHLRKNSDERATGAVLTFLRDTRVDCMIMWHPRRMRGWRGGQQERREGQTPLRIHLFLSFVFPLSFLGAVFSFGGVGKKETREPYIDGYTSLGQGNDICGGAIPVLLWQ